MKWVDRQKHFLFYASLLDWMGINRLSQMAFCIWMQRFWSEYSYCKDFSYMQCIFFLLNNEIVSLYFWAVPPLRFTDIISSDADYCKGCSQQRRCSSENWRQIFFITLLISVWGYTSYWESLSRHSSVFFSLSVCEERP